MSTTTTAAQLPADVETLMRGLRLPHARAIAADVLATQHALQTLEWVGRRENLVVCGPAGTGKTFFLEALGQKVIEAGMPVAWFTLEQIGVLVRANRADDSLGKAVAKIVRAELVAIDDVGLLPVGTDAAEGLYRIVEGAYERRSVAISSNLHPSGFDELMPKRWPPPPSTDSCITLTCAKPAATPCAGPSPARERSTTLT
jgi:DNA replication protein DnaC